MEFRLDFFFRIIMDTAYYAVNIWFYLVMFEHTESIGGWNKEQALIFVGCYLVVDAINMTLFANNVWQIPSLINKGGLDYYLTKPVNTFAFISYRDFAFGSFINFLMAVGFLLWAVLSSALGWQTIPMIVLALTLLMGSLLYHVIHMLFLLPVFWSQSASNSMNSIFYVCIRCMERPDSIFTGVVRLFLMVVIPAIIMASFPARLYIDGFDWGIFGIIVAVTIGVTSGVVGLWSIGLKHYSSASS